jgi:hypothetical protein
VPLGHYGVLVGDLTEHHRDDPDNQGAWYHVNLALSAPAGQYRCAIDVDSHQSAVGVQWKVLRVPIGAVGPVGGLPTGYHDLGHSEAVGALDLIRHTALVDNPGCWFVQRPPEWLESLIARFLPRRPWSSGSNVDAATALESILVIGRRTLVWGEPFRPGQLGMHNVHQNQGDPAGSQWWDDNAIWQDGGVMVLRPDGDLDAFVSKFTSQAAQTDANGHPV